MRFQTNIGYAYLMRWDGICLYEKKTRQINVLFRINWLGCNSIKMGLGGMLVCYFVKIDIYLAADIIIIYQDTFSPKKCIFYYCNLNHFIVRAPFMSYDLTL